MTRFRKLSLLLMVLVAGEILSRWLGPMVIAPEDAWSAEGSLREDLDAWIDGARLRTDRSGARLSGETNTADLRFLAVGGELVAGVGVDERDWFGSRLSRVSREIDGRDLLVRAVAMRSDLENRFLLLRAEIVRFKPSHVIIEIAGEDLSFDGRTSRMGGDALKLEPLRRTPSSLWNLWEFSRWRAARRELERRAGQYVERWNFFANADENHEKRTAGILRLNPRELSKLGSEDRDLVRWILMDRFGIELADRRKRLCESFGRLLDELRDQRIDVLVIVRGPQFVTDEILAVAERVGFPVVHAVPYMMDAGLRIGGQGEHPCALVHDQLASSLLEAVRRRGFPGVDPKIPDSIARAARAVESFHKSDLGKESVLLSWAKSLVPVGHAFTGVDEVVPFVFSGLDAGGRLDGRGTAEAVLRLPPRQDEQVESLHLSVVASVPASAAFDESLEVFWPVLDVFHPQSLGQKRPPTAIATPAGADSSRRHVEYRFEMPDCPEVLLYLSFRLALPDRDRLPDFKVESVSF